MGTESGPVFYGTTSSGVPIQHLDYKYVEKCTDTKELEKILKVLRSGEEGHYPELVEFTEKRLETINPRSRALRKDLPVKSYHELEKADREEITDDFEEWMSDINQLDANLKSRTYEDPTSDFLPPVRSTKTEGAATSGGSQVSSSREHSAQGKKKGPVAPRSYQDWDKFNPDEQVKALEEEEEAKVKEKKEKAKLNIREARLSSDVKTSGKTDQELTFLANREKDKGNDAFRAGDYKESMVYYSRSIELQPTAAAYNNRAMAEIKLTEYAKAIQDCNNVIFMEPDNLKAFLRRAIAQKHTGKLQEARDDLAQVLEIEPNNKRAKELLDEISDEEATSTSTYKAATEDTSPKKKGGQRLKIIEVDSDDEEEEEEVVSAGAQAGEAVNGLSNQDTIENGPVRKSNNKMSEDTTDGNVIGKSGTRPGMNPGAEVKQTTLPSASNNEPVVTNTKDINGASADTTSKAVPVVNPATPSTVTHAATTGTDTQVAERPPMNVAVQPPPPPQPQRELPGVAVRAKDEGTRLYKLGRYAEASERYTAAIDILSKDKTHFKSALASLLYNRAASLARIGDTTGCIMDCTASLDLIPGATKPLLKRAEQQEHLEKYKEAHFDYQDVLRRDPRNQQALHANTRVNSHLYEMYGAEWRTRIAKTQPTTVTSQALLDNEAPSPPPTDGSRSNATRPTGDVGKKTGPALSAAERFKQCKERGNNFVKQGKHAEAVGCYTECISIDSKEVASYTNRALCYLRLEKNDLAEKDSTTALELQDGNLKAMYRRALARKALGRYDEAAKDLLGLIKIDPKNTSGKKELDAVLELCRKKRREAQATQPQNSTESKKAMKVKAAGKGERKDEKQPTTKNAAEPNVLRRRRVIIDEVNNDEEDSDEEEAAAKKAPCPAAKKPTSTNSQQGKGKSSKEQPPKPSPTKSSKHKKIVLNKATPYDFFQAWNTVKRNDLSSYAEILRQLEPKLLPKVLSNKLDADMFRNVIGAILHQLIPSGDECMAFEILRFICEAQRFDMAIMFLGRQDIQDIEEVFTKLGAAQNIRTSIDTKAFTALKNKYKV